MSRWPGQRFTLGLRRPGGLEQDSRLADVAQPLPRVLRQAPSQERPHRGWRPHGQGGEVGVGLDDGGEEVGDRFPAEDRPSRQHLQQHHPEGPDVGAFVHRLAPRLLRRHVGGGSEDDTGQGGPVRERRRLRVGTSRGGPALALVGLGQAEVEQLDRAIARDLDVGGLEVPVDDAVLVRVLECLGDLAGHLQGVVDWECPPGQAIGQGRALHELHDEGPRPARLLETVHRCDVGVVERSEEPRLALESGQAIGVGRDLFGQDLERHRAAQLRVGGPVDLAHPAGPHRAGDLIRPEPNACRQHLILASKKESQAKC